MRHVHVGCLNRWRSLSHNPRSYYQCDSCQYSYNLERTRLANFCHSYKVNRTPWWLGLVLHLDLALCSPLALLILLPLHGIEYGGGGEEEDGRGKKGRKGGGRHNPLCRGAMKCVRAGLCGCVGACVCVAGTRGSDG